MLLLLPFFVVVVVEYLQVVEENSLNDKVIVDDLDDMEEYLDCLILVLLQVLRRPQTRQMEDKMVVVDDEMVVH